MLKILKIIGIVFLSLLIFAGTAAFATSTTHSNLKGSTVEKVDQYVKNYVDEENFRGSVLVVQKGEVILNQSYGLADMEKNIPFSNDMLFPVGSMTKSFTAISILQLEEQGKLSVNDSLDKYFPDIAHSDKITLHHLLNHTSGYVDFLENESILEDWTKPYTDEEIMNTFKNEPLAFEPGEKYSYCNTGYYLLGKIIEKVSGLDYQSYVEKNIIEKAGLENTVFMSEENMENLQVKGYEKDEFVEQLHPTLLFGSGNLLSTKMDMAKYLTAVDTNSLLSPKQKDKMLTETTKLNTIGFLGVGYGYGWYVADAPISFNEKFYAHGGSLPGLRVGVTHYPDQDLSVIVFSNISMAWNYSELSNGIASILLKKRQWFIHKL